VIFHAWRIQKHAKIGHYRLLDGKNQRHEFGSLETCLQKLEEIKKTNNLPPMSDEVVLVLHGLGASRHFMEPLAKLLREKGNLTVVNISYASTLQSIEEHALTLACLIEHLDGPHKISFVAHSMGNLVIRHYLHDNQLLTPQTRPKIEFQRFVMIAPPNHGAMLADQFANQRLVQLIAGAPLGQLAPNEQWKDLERRLTTPDFEFGILVGGQGNDEGYLKTLPGDDDCLLTVETSKLSGASDFAQVRGIHQLLPSNKQIQLCALRFLKFGYFISAEKINPIP